MVCPVIATEPALFKGLDGLLPAPAAVPFAVATSNLPRSAMIVADLLALDARLHLLILILVGHPHPAGASPTGVAILLADVLADDTSFVSGPIAVVIDVVVADLSNSWLDGRIIVIAVTVLLYCMALIGCAKARRVARPVFI